MPNHIEVIQFNLFSQLEQVKRRSYEQCIREVDHGTFEDPPVREAGSKVENVDELITKLKEAGVV
jgi:hypothetical protein